MKKATSNTIRTRLDALRKLMQREGISLYMISDTDYHLAQFQCEYFKSLEYMSGFTGNNAMMVITLENAHLWTDSRYANQAEKELEGTGIILHIDNNTEDVIRTIPLFFEASSNAIVQNMFENGFDGKSDKGSKYVIAFDGRTFRFSLIDEIISLMGFAYENGVVEFDARQDLISDIWKDRPEIISERIYVLEEQYHGMSASEKLADLRAEIGVYGTKAAAVITSLDDVAWLYNIRGNDIPYSVTAYAYGYVNYDNAYLFIDDNKVTGRVKEQLKEQGITLRHYDEFYSFLEKTDDDVIFVDPDKSSFAVIITIDSPGSRVIISRESLIEDRKAIKNAKEATNASFSGISDGVAVTRFIFWLQQNVAREQITELDACKKLWELREEAGAIKPCFETICAYGSHSDFVHYAPTEKTNAVIEPKGMLLLDSGAHYMGATTEVTRTIPVGPLTNAEKDQYTILLAGMMEFAAAIFPQGITDAQLDVIAMQPLWRHGMRVIHSTGHGIGAMLDVQEGPHSIDWSKVYHPVPIKAGMVTTCEPGLYYEGEYGIRHANTYLCVARGGDFLNFTELTYVPFDTSALNLDLMTETQIQTLNEYHEKLRLIILPELEGDDIRAWFIKRTEPIAR